MISSVALADAELSLPSLATPNLNVKPNAARSWLQLSPQLLSRTTELAKEPVLSLARILRSHDSIWACLETKLDRIPQWPLGSSVPKPSKHCWGILDDWVHGERHGQAMGSSRKPQPRGWGISEIIMKYHYCCCSALPLPCNLPVGSLGGACFSMPTKRTENTIWCCRSLQSLKYLFVIEGLSS